MNFQATSAVCGESRITLRLEMACELAAVRTATLAVRDWLAEKGLPEMELGGWELALAEAANNAVKYANARGRQQPVTIEVLWGEREIEARITDHTAGFDWPDKAELPDVDAESGRGLFLIQSLTDEVVYLRHRDQNILILRRARPPGVAEPLPNVRQLQSQLADTEAALADMTAELSSSYESLVALFRYSSELGAHASLKDFSQRLLKDLMQITEADRAVLRLVSPDGKKLEPLLLLPDDQQFTLKPIRLAGAPASVEISAARKQQDIWFSPEEPLAGDDPLRAAIPTGNGICHPFFVANQLVGTATLARSGEDKPFAAAQVNLLHSFIDFLAIQIVNARLLDERTSAQITRRELEIAANIQHSLLPMKIPACPPFEMSAAYQSALQVGGDFYDIIPAGDGSLLLVIADVMGKGVPAALFAAVLRSTLRSMPQLFNQPAELMATANRILFPDLTRVDMFVTALVACLDPHRRKLLAANAGHCPILLWQPGMAQAVAYGESGFPLGIEPLTRYLQTEIDLPPGASMLLYTDGLSETRNAAGELLGEEKLIQIFTQAATQTSDTASGKQFLLTRLNDFRNQAPMTDDQTLVFIRHTA